MNLKHFNSPQSIQSFASFLRSNNTPKSTISRKISAIKSFSEYLKQRHIISKPVQKIESEIFPQVTPKFFNKYIIWATIFLILLGSLSVLYIQLSNNAKKQLAYSTASNPTVGSRILSFQGRLTDTSGNPITSETGIIFKLYNNSVGGTELYTSGSGNSQTVIPDENGIFNSVIGKSHGTAIPSSVFTEHAEVWLEISTDSEIMTPRQQIATVAYALNSETLQGLPPSASGLKNTVLVIGESGNIYLGETSPSIISTSGTFGIEGQALLLKASDGSGGNITINPDANGIIRLITEGAGSTAVGGAIDITNANFTTGNLINGQINNDNRGYNFLDFSNYNIGTTQLATRFSVSAGGNLSAGGTITFTGLNNGSGTTAVFIDGSGMLSKRSLGALAFADTAIGTTYAAGGGLTLSSNIFSLNLGSTNTWTGPQTFNNRFSIGDTNGNNLVDISETGAQFNLPTTFTSTGDVNLANNLNFTNSTSSIIKSASPFYIEAGEVFNSSDLTLKTYNYGNVIIDSSNLNIGGSITAASLPIGTGSSVVFIDANGVFSKGLAVGTTYSAGIGLTLSNTNVFSLNLGNTNVWLAPQYFSTGIGVTGNSTFQNNLTIGGTFISVGSTNLVSNLNANYLNGIASSGFLQNITAGVGISLNGSGIGRTIAIDFNSTNLKMTANQLNTIQDIATASTPTFAGLGIGATNSSYGLFINGLGIGVSGNSYFGGNITVGGTFISVGSTNLVTNLNANYLNGYSYSAFIYTASNGVTQVGNDFRLNLGTTNVWLASQFFSSNVGITGNLTVGGTFVSVGSTNLVTNLNANYLNGISSNGFLQNITAGVGISLNGTGIGRTIAIDFNSTNLKITTNQLNTIQDIATASTPTFAGLGIGATNSSYGLFINGLGIGVSGNSYFGGNITVGGTFISVGSTNLVTNLNANYLNGYSYSAFIYTASNGVTQVGNDFRLGGSLTALTKIDQNSNDFGFYGTGSIGIGTTSPTKKLDIAGDINLTGTIFATGTSGSNGQVLSSTGTGLQWISAGGVGTTYSAGIGLTLSNINIFSLNLASINTWTGLQTFDAIGAPFAVGSTTMVNNLNAQYLGGIDSSGFDNYRNWGLQTNSGDTTPVTTLTNVNFISGVGISISQVGTSIVFSNVGLTTPYTASNGVTLVNTDIQLGGSLSQLTKIDQNSNNFAFYGTGNVGIGTTDPTQRFDVNGSVNIGGSLSIGSTYLVSNLNSNYLEGYTASNLPYVSNTTDTTLTRSGTGPYTLGINLTNDNTWTGIQTFNAPNVPFAVGSSGLVTNLNADLLDGYHANNLPYEAPLTFDNGLTRINNNIALGGTLSQDTVINMSSYGLQFRDVGGSIALNLTSNGFVGIGGTSSGPNFPLHVEAIGDSGVSAQFEGFVAAQKFIDIGGFDNYYLDLAYNGSLGNASSLSLDVLGSIKFNSTYDINTSQWQRLSNGPSIKIESIYDVINDNGGLYLGVATIGGSATDIGTSWDNGIFISGKADTTGFVGLGTTAPTSRLEIANSTSTISNDAGDITIIPASGLLSLSGNNIGNILNAYVAGSIGIGTTVPVGKLGIVYDGDNSITLNSADTDASQFSLGINTIQGYSLINSSATGTGTTQPIVFAIAGSEKLRLATNGYVGIGTTNPSARLSLGVNLASGFLDTYSKYQVLLYDAGIGSADYSYGFGIKANTMVLNSGAGAYSFDRSGNASTMYMDTTGNVGIGTTSPVSKLSLGNANTGYLNRIALYETTAGANDFRGIGMANPSAGVFGVGIWANKGPSNANMDMFIKDGGYVGIGTTNPGYPLQVNGSVAIGNGSGLIWSDTGGTFGNQITRQEVNGSMKLTSGQAHILLMPSSYVGIGTTSPSQKLDVRGNIQAANTDFVLGSAGSMLIMGQLANSGNVNSYIQAYNTGAWVVANLVLQNTGGNVGIGTTSPAYLLHVNADTTGYIARFQNSNGGTSDNGLMVSVGVGLSRATTTRYIEFTGSNSTTVNGKISGAGLSTVGVLYQATGADYAEWFKIPDYSYKSNIGYVVQAAADGTIIKATDQKPIGVISNTAGYAGNDTSSCESGDDVCNQNFEDSHVLVGMMGQIRMYTSTENGPISIGDPLAVSSIPGVVAKATKAGYTVGHALENYSGTEIVKINSYINPSWYDPDISITADGQVSVEYNVTPEVLASLGYDGTKNEIENAIYSNKINTGLVKTINLIAQNIVVENLFSQRSTIHDLKTAVITPLDQITDTIVIDGNLKAREASFSSVYADQIINKEGNITDIMAQKISELRTEITNLMATTPASTPSAIALAASTWDTSVATESAALVVDNMSITNDLMIGSNLIVNGQTTLSKAYITDTLAIGQIAINNNIIETTASTLFIQPSGIGSIDFLKSKLIVSDDGNITVNAKITATEASFSGSVIANLLKTPNLEADTATIGKLIIAVGSTIPESTQSAEISSNTTAGTTTLPTGTTEITINNSKLTASSMIYLTPNGSTNNQVVFVKSKDVRAPLVGAPTPTDLPSSFTIGIDSTLPSDLSINWWIIN